MNNAYPTTEKEYFIEFVKKYYIEKEIYIDDIDMEYINRFLSIDDKIKLDYIYLLDRTEFEDNFEKLSINLKIQYFTNNLNKQYHNELYKKFLNELSNDDLIKYIDKIDYIDADTLQYLINNKNMLNDKLLDLIITKIDNTYCINMIWNSLNDEYKLALCKNLCIGN